MFVESGESFLLQLNEMQARIGVGDVAYFVNKFAPKSTDIG